MIVVTVARRPVLAPTVAAGVLQDGCGGLDVDRSRIGLAGDSRRSPCGADGQVHRTKGDVYGNPTSGGSFDVTQGRWPTNVILEHLTECVFAGVRRVRGTGSRDGGSGARFKEAGNLYARPGKEGVRTAHPGFADSDGTEPVTAWECSPSCPVQILDVQSGMSRSSGFGGRVVVKQRTGREGDGNAHGKYGAESRSEGSVMVTHDDEGGASRFFKQVKG